MMKLDIILRTHSTSNVHGGERYVGAPKEEVMLRCTNSLVTSMNAADADILLTVVDDRSTPEALEKLQKILARSKYPVELTHCDAKIQNDSTLAQFKAGLEKGREVVYFVEDDYLHTLSAIQEMIDSYQLFKQKLGGREVAIHPYDNPDRYIRDGSEPCRIVYGPKRHWRTVTHTTNTCVLSHELLKRRWSLFERLAFEYKSGGGLTEEDTINKIWREDAITFAPLPTLALHLQYEAHKVPYVDWKSWWDAAAYI